MIRFSPLFKLSSLHGNGEIISLSFDDLTDSMFSLLRELHLKD